MKKNLNFTQITKDFIKFKNIHSQKLKNKNILNDNEYYLVNNSWYKVFSDNFFGYKPKNDLNKIFSENFPIFFFNIESIIEFLSKKGDKLALISKSLISQIYEEDKFKNDNLINFYFGNNKEIIEFIGDKENDILLINNPLQKNPNENNEFILKIKNDEIHKKDLFEKIMSSNNLYDNKLIEIIKNNNIVISFSNLNDKEKNENSHQDYKREIVKIFIFIYYYENSLKIEPNKIFMNSKQCYLIIPDWIEQLKNYYDYQSLQNLISGYTNKEINYSNLNKHLDELLLFLKSNFIEKMKLPEEPIISDLFTKLESKDDIIYIIPEEIMDLIMEHLFKNKKILIEPKSLIINDNNNIFISDSSKVIYGNLNDNLLFNSKYIFSYSNKNILDEEKVILYSKSIKEYMDLRGCDSNLHFNNQNIKKNDEIIDNLFISFGNNIECNKEKETSFNNQENSTHKNESNIICQNIDNNSDGEEFNQNHEEEKTDNNAQGFKLLRKKTFLNNKSLNNQEDKIAKQSLIENKINESNNNESGEKLVNLEENKIEKSDYVLDEIDDGKKELKKVNTKEKNLIKISEIIRYQINNSDKFREDIEKEIELEKNKIEEKYKKCIEDKDKEIQSLYEKNTKTQEDFAITQNKLKENENEINNLKETIKEKDKNEENYKTQIKELKKSNNDLEKKNEELTNKKNEINNMMSDLSEKEKFIEKEMIELKKEKEKFEIDKNENIKIKQENEELITKNEELKKEIEKNKSELDKLLLSIEETNKNIRIPQNPLYQSFGNISRRNSRNPQNPLFQSIDNDTLINYLDKNKEIKNKNSIIYQKPLIKEKKEKEEEKKEEEEKEEEELEREEEVEKPILIGLNNIGATCFMNSTLQCLSQTKSLTDYFLNEKNTDRIINNNICIKNKNDLQLSPAYHDLIKQLWDKNGPKSFSPSHFMGVIEKLNPLFKKGQAGDSKDFIIFILEQLHKELKSPLSGINQIDIALNQYDRLNAFNYFFNDFKKECSIISDIFFGFNETTNECLNCKNIYNMNGLCNPICYNYGLFNCLIFPLEEVKNMKNINIQNNLNNTVTIYDCFYYNQKSEMFTGENRNYCNICKQLYDSIYTTNIFIGPNNLILILNRGKGNIYNVKLEFSEIIDISQFIMQKDKPQIFYSLYGVITHIGQSGPNAHFVASCKSSIDNKWYRFNDAFVNPITNIQKEIIEFGTPYILFYQKN